MAASKRRLYFVGGLTATLIAGAALSGCGTVHEGQGDSPSGAVSESAAVSASVELPPMSLAPATGAPVSGVAATSSATSEAAVRLSKSGQPIGAVDLSIVRRQEGLFLEVGLDSAGTAPDLAYWDVSVNGRFGVRVSAPTGGTLGHRLLDEGADQFVVAVAAVTEDGETVATTGDVVVSGGSQ
jgi:hypothetical protein